MEKPSFIALLAVYLIGFPPAAAGQEPGRDSIPTDVRVGIVYQPGFRPGIVVPAMTEVTFRWPNRIEANGADVATVISDPLRKSPTVAFTVRGAASASNRKL